MLTAMQLLWIQYWTALPVIVEDRDMSDGGQTGQRIPPGTIPIDPSTQYRPSESEGNTRMFICAAALLWLTLSRGALRLSHSNRGRQSCSLRFPLSTKSFTATFLEWPASLWVRTQCTSFQRTSTTQWGVQHAGHGWGAARLFEH